MVFKINPLKGTLLVLTPKQSLGTPSQRLEVFLRLIKKKIFQVFNISLALIILSSFSINQNSLAKSGFKTKVIDFTEVLNNQMENYLKTSLNRNKVGFRISNKSSEYLAQLTIPSHIERETVFNLKISTDEGQSHINISGNVLTDDQKELVSNLAKNIFDRYDIKTNVDSFPFDNINLDYAIVTKPYADSFVQPNKKDLATQLLSGTPLKILEISKDKRFAKVQSADDYYISWISRQDIKEIDQAKWLSWKNSRNIIINKDIKSPTRLYFGTILPGTISANSVKLLLPSGKSVNLTKTEVKIFSELHGDVGGLLKTARDLLKIGQMGKTAYLWGGTAGTNLDCSGFNQTVFRSEGILLPRDADQQQNFSTPIAAKLRNIAELQPGDLIFFSDNNQYATHTGVYVGNNQFIHSSTGGSYRGVKISTLKGGIDYDKKLQAMYFGAGRLNL